MSQRMPLFVALARKLAWDCPDTKWQSVKDSLIDSLVDMLPSGSGIDCGSKLLDSSKPDCIRIQADFHHINEHGYYDGWTEHIVTIRPSLQYGFTLSISGRNRNEIKDYLYELFDYALRQNVEQVESKYVRVPDEIRVSTVYP